MTKNQKSTINKKPIMAKDPVETSINSSEEIESLKKQIISTQNQLNEIQKMLLDNINDTKNSNINKTDSMDRWCTIIHLEDRAEGLYTIFHSSLIEYRFSFFGESRKVRRAELDDIISKNRKLFDRMILTLGADDSDLVEEYGLPKVEQVILQPRQLSNIVNLSLEELQKIYNKVCDTHKQLIIRKWVTGYYENKDGGYRNMNKINLLNDLSNCALSHIVDDINELRRTKRS